MRRARSTRRKPRTAARSSTTAWAPCRSRRTTASIRRTSSTSTAPTPRASSSSSPRRRPARSNGRTKAWPEPDPAALEQDEIEYVVQINGKKKGTLKAPKTLDQKGLELLVRASELIKKYIGEQAIRRIIIVPGRLINIVV